jgi:hypothetical protein
MLGGWYLVEHESKYTGLTHEALLQVQLVVELEPTGISPARFEDRELRMAPGSESRDRPLDSAILRTVKCKVLMTARAPPVGFVHSHKRRLAPPVIPMTLGARWNLGRDLRRVMCRAGMTRLAPSVDTPRRHRRGTDMTGLARGFPGRVLLDQGARHGGCGKVQQPDGPRDHQERNQENCEPSRVP